MKKIIINLALIGMFLMPVNSSAFDCTSYLPSYVSFGASVSSMLDFVQKYDFFINEENSPIRNNSVCTPVQITDDVRNIYVSSDYVSPNNSDRALVVSCVGGDCITDPDRIGGSWSQWDNSLKRLVSVDGSYIGLDGIFHFSKYYVSSSDDFKNDGKRMDSAGKVLTSVPSLQLPLNDLGFNCLILGILPEEIDSEVFSSVSGVRCFGLGKIDNVQYNSYVIAPGPNSSVGGAALLQNDRDNGINVVDSREQKLRDIKKDLAETHDSTKINEKGAELKFSGNDYKVYVPEDSFDGVPFVFSNDFLVDFNTDPEVTNDPALFGGSSGSSLLQKEGIALLAQLFDDNASTNNAGNLSLQITEEGAELTFKNSGIGISSVQNEGLDLTQGDIEAIRDSLIGSSYGASGSTIYIGSGSGGGGGGDSGGQLPTDPAPSAEDGIGTKSDGEVYEPAAYLGELEKDCESIECVYSSYEAQFKQKPFIQLIGSLVPPESNDPLPVISGVLLGAPYSIDFQEMSGGLDIFKNMLLLTASITGIRIILASPA